MPVSFETFLRFWIAENIQAGADRIDPKALDSMVRLLSDQLTEDATVNGFYREVVEAAKPYGGVQGYVRHELEAARQRR